jgi:succinoglycan biosynthesis transport protein ExoP
VSNSQMNLRDIIGVVKRRKMILLLPPVIVTVICTTAAFLLPRMYESSIRMLVQRREVQNPLTAIANAMSESIIDDPLNLFDDIIYSQKVVGQLIDSLDLDANIHSEAERRSLHVQVHRNIQTKIQLNESFTITYFSDQPIQAQRGATILAEIYIQTVTAAKNQAHQLTVEFYQSKLEEFQQKLEASQRQMVSKLRGRAQSSPSGNMYLYTRLDQLDQQIRELEGRIKENEQNLVTTRTPPEQVATTAGLQTLFELQRTEVPYSLELRGLLKNYEEILSKYTPKHPEATKMSTQITELLDRIGFALRTEIGKKKGQLADLRSDRGKIVDQILNTSTGGNEDQNKQSNYSIYQRLYNEMKVKLEEAQISLALGKNDENRYTIIDQALLPLYSSKPSRIMIVGGGGMFGIILGIISVIVAEFLDTTIRSPKEIIAFRKPIIGLLPDARKKTSV